jgi:D-alanine transaminase
MVYVQVTRGVWPREFEFPASPRPTVLAYARRRPAVTTAAIMAGETLHPVEDSRWARCDVKATDLLAALLAKEEARSAGAQEALFVSPDGIVREGGSSNVFAVVDGVVRTHPADYHILAGITRRHVLEMARSAGYAVEERAFTLAEVISAAHSDREVFLASTLKDIMPVLRVGTHVIGSSRPGGVTLALLDIMRRQLALLVGADLPSALT